MSSIANNISLAMAVAKRKGLKVQYSIQFDTAYTITLPNGVVYKSPTVQDMINYVRGY